MTPEAQRIAIAEACGWTNFSKSESPDFWYAPGERYKELCRTHRLPDYLNDLNAMYDAEETLASSELSAMIYELAKIIHHSGHIAHSTAAQRAEAFLRVKGLWK